MASAPPISLTGYAPYLSGLRLRPADTRAALVAVLASSVGVTAFILVLDLLLFREALPAHYVAFYTSPLMPRTLVACTLAAIEEVLFRLVLMTALVVGISAWRGPLSPRLFVAVILAAQLANTGALVAADPLYAGLRFWAVGCVWGWLYWRHGWLPALGGHASAHLLLDPLLAFALIHT